MDSSRIAQVVPALKGAQLSVLVVFLLSVDHVAYGTNDLASLCGYSRPVTAQALQALALKGMVQKLGRYNGWVLTAVVRQMFLRNADGEGKIFTLATSIGSSSTDILNIDNTTSSLEPEGKKVTLDVDALAAVEFLVAGGIVRCAISGKGAEDSVREALRGGFDGQRCLECVTRWIVYAESPAGAWIRSMYAFAAAKLRDGVFPPRVVDKTDPRRYVEAEYEHLIKH